MQDCPVRLDMAAQHACTLVEVCGDVWKARDQALSNAETDEPRLGYWLAVFDVLTRVAEA